MLPDSVLHPEWDQRQSGRVLRLRADWFSLRVVAVHLQHPQWTRVSNFRFRDFYFPMTLRDYIYIYV